MSVAGEGEMMFIHTQDSLQAQLEDRIRELKKTRRCN
jgi:hypothetical protein